MLLWVIGWHSIHRRGSHWDLTHWGTGHWHDRRLHLWCHLAFSGSLVKVVEVDGLGHILGDGTINTTDTLGYRDALALAVVEECSAGLVCWSVRDVTLFS